MRTTVTLVSRYGYSYNRYWEVSRANPPWCSTKEGVVPTTGVKPPNPSNSRHESNQASRKSHGLKRRDSVAWVQVSTLHLCLQVRSHWMRCVAVMQRLAAKTTQHAARCKRTLRHMFIPWFCDIFGKRPHSINLLPYFPGPKRATVQNLQFLPVARGRKPAANCCLLLEPFSCRPPWTVCNCELNYFPYACTGRHSARAVKKTSQQTHGPWRQGVVTTQPCEIQLHRTMTGWLIIRPGIGLRVDTHARLSVPGTAIRSLKAYSAIHHAASETLLDWTELFSSGQFGYGHG